MKRIIDLSLAMFFVIFLLIPMLAIAFLIKITSNGCVIYWSDRIGKNNKIFKMPKFRSMLISTPALATHLLDNPDAYLSPIGGFLRRSSLDELPQLFSVLKGDMSLVGPRPLLMEYLPLYSPEQARRHETRPGITGWAQVNGRNAISWEQKFEYDVWYVDNQSLWLDIKIIFLTLKKVFVRDGISAVGEATMSKFTGSVNK